MYHSLFAHWLVAAAAAAAKSLQLCPTLCNPRDGSPPGSPVPGILQARTLEWVAISFYNAWKWEVKSESEVAQSCQTPSDPMDCSPPGSSVHGILQAGVLEWGAIAFSWLVEKHLNCFPWGTPSNKTAINFHIEFCAKGSLHFPVMKAQRAVAGWQKSDCIPLYFLRSCHAVFQSASCILHSYQHLVQSLFFYFNYIYFI